jgi:hypothetical protein
MLEKNNPVLIATPRTGSTVMVKMLYNIARHKFGSKNYLNQYLTVTPHYREKFDKVDGVIQSLSYVREKNKFLEDHLYRDTITKNRLKLLEGDTKYTTKVFTQDFNGETYEFFKKHFDFIFLERRDKLTQLLSFCTMMETNKFEYRPTEEINNGYFSFSECMTFFGLMMHYTKIKNLNPNAPVIFYEDFMAKGGNTPALLDLLGLPVEDIPKAIKIDTIPTPYQTNIEDILVNKAEWLAAKPTIIKLLETFN